MATMSLGLHIFFAKYGANAFFYRGPNVGWLMLHPAGLWVYLWEFKIDAAAQLASVIHEGDGATRRPLVNGENKLSHKELARSNLRSRPQPLFQGNR